MKKTTFKIKYPIPGDCKSCEFRDKAAEYMPCCTYPGNIKWDVFGTCWSRRFEPLTAYEITYSDGSTSRTNMAAGVTLDQARKYFIGQRFNLGMYGIKENIQTAVRVRKIE